MLEMAIVLVSVGVLMMRRREWGENTKSIF